ncbi:MAG: hypothetical protein POH28_00550 [Acidocella sp.]|nr:hypothetical protein [Acidocella sp.]
MMRTIGKIVRDLVKVTRQRLRQGDDLPIFGTNTLQALHYLCENRQAFRSSWNHTVFNTPGASRSDIVQLMDRYFSQDCPDIESEDVLSDSGHNSFSAQPDPPGDWFITSTPESVFEEIFLHGR